MTAVEALSLLALVIIIVQSWGLAFLYILGACATSLCLLVPQVSQSWSPSRSESHSQDGDQEGSTVF